MPAPDVVHQLVKRFEENLDSYRSGKYNETQLRREFLDPLFEALGWDVFNKAGYAEAYKDVIHEDSIEVAGATKAPDYAFRIGGQRKFFLEAKKPSVKVETDIYPAFQLRRYSWSAKLPIGILSDFEEFAVYESRSKPNKKDKASTGRIAYYKFTEYIEKWDEIADVFSREAVLKGSFDKFAEGKRKKKGTAEVDDAFLEEIERWRELLAKNFALRNKSLTTRELNYAVQVTIDRIVFLRICEDRGIEPYEKLKNASTPTAFGTSPKSALDLGEDGRGSVYAELVKIFQQADTRYNSGLFHFKDEKNAGSAADSLTLSLTVDDKVLKEILGSLYYPESPYVFSEIPSDILGQVYERFLGKVIRLTAGHQAKVEEKPEVRKAGGVYYTPTYIVEYIVKNTVGKLLEGDPSPSPDGKAQSGEGSFTPKEVEKLKILDPACGSGTFAIGAYQYLLDWHRDWYSNNDPKKLAKSKNPPIFQGKEGWQLTVSKKKEILLNNIFGVDIDPQAVEVTKLSLLLKLVEDPGQLDFMGERILPYLGDNIKCGNSLIGPDYYDGQQLTMGFDEEERYRVNAFDWTTEFAAIFNRGGFDAVIGNPPYGAYLYEKEKDYLLENYVCQSYQLDSYLLFLEKSIKNILDSKGLFGMIIPNPWITNLLQTATRKFVVENTKVIEIIHFLYPVFKRVTVDTQIVILQKDKPDGWAPQTTIVDKHGNLVSGQNLIHFSHKQDLWRSLKGGVINIFMKPEEIELAEKIRRESIKLDELFEINVGIKPYQTGKGKPPQTRQTVRDRPFDSDRKKDKSFRSYLRGKDIRRFEINPLEPRFLKFGPWLAEPRPAADFDAPEKIFMRQTGDSIVATIDTEKYLCLNNMHVIVPKENQFSIKYVLGVINSKLVNWYYHSLNPEVGEALAEVKKTNVAKLPVYPINFSDAEDKARHDKLVSLVERMLELHKSSPRMPGDKERVKREFESTDKQIDRLVYELYGLTDEEIKIVEGRDV